MNKLINYIKSIGYEKTSNKSHDGFCDIYIKDDKKIVFGKSLKGSKPTLIKPSINAKYFIRTAMGYTASVWIDPLNSDAVNHVLIYEDPEIIYNSLFDKSTMLIFNQ